MLEGLRTRCRPVEDADQQFLHRLNSDPVVRGNVVGWDLPRSLAEQERWFARGADPRTTRWVIEARDDGRPIGLTGLWDIDWHSRNAVAGIKIGGAPDLRGKGFGSDAIKAVMAFAFYDVGLERLHSTVLAGNEASIRLFTGTCGWKVEGRARRHAWRDGGFVDVLFIGALRNEFEALPDHRTYREMALVGGAEAGSLRHE